VTHPLKIADFMRRAVALP